jgi:hypothetical protein
MKFVAKSIALAALVLVTAGPSYAEPLRSTSIPSSLAADEKKLMPAVMTEFYGSFDREKTCWMSKHKDGEYLSVSLVTNAHETSNQLKRQRHISIKL